MKRVLASLLVSLFCFSLVLVPASAAVVPDSDQQYHGSVYVNWTDSTTSYILSPNQISIFSDFSGEFPRNEFNNWRVLYLSSSPQASVEQKSLQIAVIPDVALTGHFGIIVNYWSGITDSSKASYFNGKDLTLYKVRAMYPGFSADLSYTIVNSISESGVSYLDFDYPPTNIDGDRAYISNVRRYHLSFSVSDSRSLSSFILVNGLSNYVSSVDGGQYSAMVADVPVLTMFPLVGDMTIDEVIFDVLDRLISLDTMVSNNLPNIAQGIINIYNQLKDMGLQLDDIKSVLDIISGLNQSQLEQLQKISSSVDAIYYFLTEALKSESDSVNETTQGAIQDIDNSQQAEDYWQSSMQGNYDSLDLEGFSFGGLAAPLTLVGSIFSDMWTAFGSYSIIFTFPLILGIALLVIGRIGKSGGGGSSRRGGKGGTDDA